MEVMLPIKAEGKKQTKKLTQIKRTVVVSCFSLRLVIFLTFFVFETRPGCRESTASPLAAAIIPRTSLPVFLTRLKAIF